MYATREIVRTFFHDVPATSKGEQTKSKFQCTCGISRTQDLKKGLTNLISHIKNDHEDWEQVMNSKKKDGAHTLFVNRKGSLIFNWMEWVIMDNHSFNFVEKPLTKKHSKLESISVDTLMKYIQLETQAVEKKVASDLPSKFGIVIDGWKEGTTHYIALFASYDGKFPLLAIAPPFNEQDYSALSHKAFIIDVLELFGKGPSNLLYLVADNAPVNTCLADLLQIPMIGCASHRFNLACKSYLEKYEPTISKINSLMVSLRNVKQAGKLRTKTLLEPVIRNDTRWSSTHDMVLRFFRIREFLDDTDPALVHNMPTPLEVNELSLALEDLKEFDSTTTLLQDEKRTLSEVRAIFDAILSKYPEMGRYISERGNIVFSPNFESGLVKLQDDHWEDLSPEQVLLMRPFLLENAESDLQIISPTKPTTIAAAALKTKKRKIVACPYVDVSHIPPTSNLVERLFSSARLVLTDYRKSMTPYTFECVMFLKFNRHYWENVLVSKLVGK
jgi:hypothetical protein